MSSTNFYDFDNNVPGTPPPSGLYDQDGTTVPLSSPSNETVPNCLRKVDTTVPGSQPEMPEPAPAPEHDLEALKKAVQVEEPQAKPSTNIVSDMPDTFVGVDELFDMNGVSYHFPEMDLNSFHQEQPHPNRSALPIGTQNWTPQGDISQNCTSYVNTVNAVNRQPAPAQPVDFNSVGNLMTTYQTFQLQNTEWPPMQTYNNMPHLSVAPHDIPWKSTEVDHDDNFPGINVQVPPEHAPTSRPHSQYNPPEMVDPDYVPQGNPIPHKRSEKNAPPPNFYPEWKFHDWGYTGKDSNAATFRYHKSGEWVNQLTFSKEELGFYFNHTQRYLTMWVQHQPAQYTHRFAQGSYAMKCRFKDCLAKNRTILKGFWRVAFDERAFFDVPLESGTLYDPFHNAGYVHLYCLEKHFDLLALCETFTVKADNRNLKFEERNPMKIARDHIELSDTFTTWRCARENERQRRLRARHPNAYQQPSNKKFKLWYMLTERVVELDGASRKSCRQIRGGISLDKHMGDLKRYERQVENRLQKQKNIRAKEKAEEAEEAAREAALRAVDRRGSSHSNSTLRRSQSPIAPNVQRRLSTELGAKRAWDHAGLLPPAKRTKQERVGSVHIQDAPPTQIKSALPEHQRLKREYDVEENEDSLPHRSKRLKGGPEPHIPVDPDTMKRYSLDYKRRYQLRYASAPPARPPKRGSLRRE